VAHTGALRQWRHEQQIEPTYPPGLAGTARQEHAALHEALTRSPNRGGRLRGWCQQGGRPLYQAWLERPADREAE